MNCNEQVCGHAVWGCFQDGRGDIVSDLGLAGTPPRFGEQQLYVNTRAVLPQRLNCVKHGVMVQSCAETGTRQTRVGVCDRSVQRTVSGKRCVCGSFGQKLAPDFAQASRHGFVARFHLPRPAPRAEGDCESFGRLLHLGDADLGNEVDRVAFERDLERSARACLIAAIEESDTEEPMRINRGGQLRYDGFERGDGRPRVALAKRGSRGDTRLRVCATGPDCFRGTIRDAISATDRREFPPRHRARTYTHHA
jgi:hypothetical protein